MRKIVKGCQLMMHANTILAVENIQLRQTLERRERKQRQRRQFITHGGALQVEEGQRLAAEAERVLPEGGQEATLRKQRAPPTCSKCHIQGHSRAQCTQR